MKTSFHIGTSGWHYKHWLGVFYPEGTPPGKMFDFYSRHFNTVEINNTFYRLPLPKTFDSWRDNSPRSFCFAVKGSRFITHMKKLKDPETSTEKFFSATEHLQKKLGPILFQLPPRWKPDLDRLNKFLEVLPRRHRYVLEFRDAGWFRPEVFRLMRDHNVAFCIHDFADMKIPQEITADFTYLRFHGPTSVRYAGSYSDRQLQHWAERMKAWSSNLKAVFAYFNNDPGGVAVENASTLKKFLKIED